MSFRQKLKKKWCGGVGAGGTECSCMQGGKHMFVQMGLVGWLRFRAKVRKVSTQ